MPLSKDTRWWISLVTVFTLAVALFYRVGHSENERRKSKDEATLGGSAGGSAGGVHFYMDSGSSTSCTKGMQLVKVGQGSVCVRQHVYPNALAADIMDASASADHMKWCGAWIEAVAALRPFDRIRWGFFDVPDVERSVDAVVLAQSDAHLPKTDMSKFVRKCRATIADVEAPRLQAQHALNYLSHQTPDVFARVDDAVAHLGLLSSHFCATPGLVTIGMKRGLVVANVSSRRAPPVNVLQYAMRVLGYSSEDRAKALAHAKAISSATATAPLSAALQTTLLRHSVQDSGLGTPEVSAILQHYTYHDGEKGLEEFVAAFDESNVSAYMQSLNALCAVSIAVTGTGRAPEDLDGTDGGVATLREQSSPASSAQRLHVATSFGRARALDEDATVEFLSQDDVGATLDTTWTALAAASTRDVVPADASESFCMHATHVIFGNAIDDIAFKSLVSEVVYTRLESMTDQIRDAVSQTILSPLFGRVFRGNYFSVLTADICSKANLRVAGAPRDTWAGAARSFVAPPIANATEAASVTMLRQARAAFANRLVHAANGESICEYPPLRDALERNAYIFASGSFACAMLLPGLMTLPFADAHYDNASLISRVGFVIAHEFAHATIVYKRYWNEKGLQELLLDYEASTYTEALADVIAAAAILRLGVIDGDTLCAHLSQLWCGYVPPPSPGKRYASGTHPATNKRGDNVCAFIRRHGL